MASRRDRRPLRRRGPTRQPVPSILVVCEGRNTEPQYIRQFRTAVGNQLVEVAVIPGVGTPKTVVETAVALVRAAQNLAQRHQDAFLAYDEGWCVFDVDVHPRLPDALQQARDNGLNVALSNPSFELWLLLHFADQSAYLSRREALHALKRHCRSYNKSVDYQMFAAGYSEAVRRAQQLEERREGARDPQGNPSTDVYKLTERIRTYGRRGIT